MRDLIKKPETGFLGCFLPYPRILVCIRFKLGSVDIQMLQIYMLCFKYLFIDVTEYFFDGISDHFVDEVTKGTVGRSLMLHEIHEAEIYLALIF